MLHVWWVAAAHARLGEAPWYLLWHICPSYTAPEASCRVPVPCISPAQNWPVTVTMSRSAVLMHVHVTVTRLLIELVLQTHQPTTDRCRLTCVGVAIAKGALPKALQQHQ